MYHPCRAFVPMNYADAFYEIGKMLGISAQSETPAKVWQEQMRPMLANRINAHELMLQALERAAEALSRLPDEVFGVSSDGYVFWPIRDELLAEMRGAIKTARGEA